MVDGSRWAEWTAAARADYEAWVEHAAAPGDGVDLGEVIAHLRDALDDDAILTNGAGNFSGWVARFYQWRRFGTQLGPQSGAMGYGVPAALTAKLLHPERDVIAFAGDGDFQMCGMELATAVQEGLAIIVIVVNNGTLRDDPHAPGAALPRARDRHRPRQPRLRRAGARVRRARRADRARGGVPRGAAARADLRRAGPDRADRPTPRR